MWCVCWKLFPYHREINCVRSELCSCFLFLDVQSNSKQFIFYPATSAPKVILLLAFPKQPEKLRYPFCVELLSVRFAMLVWFHPAKLCRSDGSLKAVSSSYRYPRFALIKIKNEEWRQSKMMNSGDSFISKYAIIKIRKWSMTQIFWGKSVQSSVWVAVWWGAGVALCARPLRASVAGWAGASAWRLTPAISAEFGLYSCVWLDRNKELPCTRGFGIQRSGEQEASNSPTSKMTICLSNAQDGAKMYSSEGKI